MNDTHIMTVPDNYRPDRPFKPGELMTQHDSAFMSKAAAEYGETSTFSGFSAAANEPDINGIIATATELVEAAERWLEDVVNMEGAFVDEVALQFGSAAARQRFLDRAVQHPDIEHFNADEDWVNTSPISSRYRVRYDFLRIKGKQFRLECMEVLQGISPLHAVVDHEAVHGNFPAVVHVSFKVANRHDYKAIAGSLEDAGAVWAQGCASTYGIFSYWKIDEPGLESVYVKPRVNIRDGK